MSKPEKRIKTYRTAAHKRGLAWLITDDLAALLFKQPCFYCGSAPLPTNGIDRVDNARGYEVDNVVPCCAWCNRAKMDDPLHLMVEKAAKIALRHAPIVDCEWA